MERFIDMNHQSSSRFVKLEHLHDDAHIFVQKIKLQRSHVVTNLILEIYKDLGFKDVLLKYSDRPAQRVGDIVCTNQRGLLTAIKQSKLEYN